MWNQNKINNHIIACDLLEKIKNSIPEFIKKNNRISEYELSSYINKQFKLNNLKINKDPPIVAFNENTSFMHYYPKKNSKKLKQNTLILIDIWSRLNKKNSPYSDITWMFYYGEKIPKEILRVFNIIKKARNIALKFISNQLKKGIIPKGKDIDDITRNIIIKHKHKENILHSIGHSIGFHSPHGIYKHLNKKNKSKILKNIGYTIEPGIYIKNKFGIRSEIDFFINDKLKLIITTPVQKEIIIIKP